MEARRREMRRLPHHEQDSFCTTRPPYRQGRQLRAVKVYTVNDESQHLLINGIPTLGLQDELRKLCCRFGDIKSLVYVPNYATEKFVEAYHVQYARIQSARFAKRQMDGRSFFGGSLHVCYAPEMESISETRNKLMQRRRDVAKRCAPVGAVPGVSTSKYRSSQAESTNLAVNHNALKMCIWNGKEVTHDPRLSAPADALEKASCVNYGPQPCGPDWKDVGVRETVWTGLPKKKTDQRHKKATVKPSLPIVLPDTAKKALVVCSQPGSVQTTKDANKKALPPILRLVPSQVKGAQNKIVFHPKRSVNTDVSSGSKSLDTTIKSVRAKIRAVGVPNVNILLDKNTKAFGM